MNLNETINAKNEHYKIVYKLGGIVFYDGYKNDLNNKKKRAIIKEIAKVYHRYSFNFSVRGKYALLHDNDENYETSLANSTKSMKEFVDFIDEIINKLPVEYKTLIYSTFFDLSSNGYWWEMTYTRSTYFRHRVLAMNDFLEYAFN